MPELTRSRRLLLRGGVLLAAFVLALLVAEGYFRLRQPGQDGLRGAIAQKTALQYAPAVFARHVFPAQVQDVWGWDGARWRINPHGYRGADFTVPKPTGVRRIIVYGGSAVFNPSSTDGRDWPHRVEQKLRERGYRDVEVINAGIPGHASFDSVGRLFAEGFRFQPDYVVLYNAWNDIKMFHDTRPLLRALPVYQPDADVRVNYVNAVDRFFSFHSRLYLGFRARYIAWKLQLGVEGKQAPANDTLLDALDPDALRQYRLAVETFADVARNVGAVPVLMTQARLLAPTNTPEQQQRIHFRYQRLTPDALHAAYAETDRIVRAVAATKQAVLLDATLPLTGVDAYFQDHVHLTDAGSEALADFVAAGFAHVLGEPPLPVGSVGSGSP